MMSTVRWLDLDALMRTEPAPVPWLVEPLVARGAVSMLAGPAGVGKSLFALVLASAVAHGAGQIAGMPVTGASVVLLDAENGERVLHERAHLVALPPDRVRIGLAERFDLRHDDGRHELHVALTKTDAGLLVLDSLASLAPGLRENEADQVAPVLDRLRHLAQQASVAVLLLHHARKDGDSYRGGTALPAAVDILAVFCREREDSDRERRLLTWAPERGGKMRLAAEPDPRWLRMGVQVGRLTIGEAEPPEAHEDRERPATKRDSLRARLVAAAVESRRPMRQGDLLAAAGIERTDRTGRRALDDAIGEGELRRLDSGEYCAAEPVAGTVPQPSTSHVAGTVPQAPATVGAVCGSQGGPTGLPPCLPHADGHDAHVASPDLAARAEALAARHADLAGDAAA